MTKARTAVPKASAKKAVAVVIGSLYEQEWRAK
jgi:hypothetical protein